MRLRRAAGAAAVAGGSSLWFHLAAGGAMPSALGVGLALLLTFVVCLALASMRVTLPRLTASVSAGQLLFHGVFSVFAPHAGAASVSAAAGSHAGHIHTGALVLTPATASAQPHGPLMWAAHAAAAVVTIAAVTWADSLLTGLRALLAALLRAVVGVPAQPVVAVPARRRPTAAGGLRIILPLGAAQSPLADRAPPLAGL